MIPSTQPHTTGQTPLLSTWHGVITRTIDALTVGMKWHTGHGMLVWPWYTLGMQNIVPPEPEIQKFAETAINSTYLLGRVHVVDLLCRPQPRLVQY
jgi:hypothetical protein